MNIINNFFRFYLKGLILFILIFNFAQLNFGQSCPVNAICEELDPWRSEINGSVRLSYHGEIGFAVSGFLVNTTDNNLSKQYILTAWHNIGNVIDSNLTDWTADFKYNSPDCDENEFPTQYYSVGDLVVKEYWGSYAGASDDIALIEITTPVPSNENYSAHFLGWTTSSSSLTKGINIHHSGGWIKRANIENSSISASNPIITVNPWDYGAVLPGASGSPLVNQDLLAVGVAVSATGSQITCANWNGSTSFYTGTNFAKISNVWNVQGNFNQSTLKSYLDPNNIGSTYQTSLANYHINISNRIFSDPSEDLFRGFVSTTDKITISDVEVSNGGVLTLRSHDEIVIEDEFESDLGAEINAECFIAPMAKSNNLYTYTATTTKPTTYLLKQNFPNPFNPGTIIAYQLPTTAQVRITVYNVLGEIIAELLDEMQNSGNKEIYFDASSLSSGIYFCRIDAHGIDGFNFLDINKMVLNK